MNWLMGIICTSWSDSPNWLTQNLVHSLLRGEYLTMNDMGKQKPLSKLVSKEEKKILFWSGSTLQSFIALESSLRSEWLNQEWKMKTSFKCLWKEPLMQSLRCASWKTKMEIFETLKCFRMAFIPVSYPQPPLPQAEFFWPVNQRGFLLPGMEKNFLKRSWEAQFTRAIYLRSSFSDRRLSNPPKHGTCQ